MEKPSLSLCKGDKHDDVSFSPHSLCAVRAAHQEPEELQRRVFLFAVLTVCHVLLERFLIQQVRR